MLAFVTDVTELMHQTSALQRTLGDTLGSSLIRANGGPTSLNDMSKV